MANKSLLDLLPADQVYAVIKKRSDEIQAEAGIVFQYTQADLDAAVAKAVADEREVVLKFLRRKTFQAGAASADFMRFCEGYDRRTRELRDFVRARGGAR